MKIVLSWLVANLEVTMAVIISAILIPIYLVRMDLIQYVGGDGWIMVASMLVVTFLPVAFTTKNFGNSVGMFILLLAGYIYLYSVSGDLPADSPYYPPVRRMMFDAVCQQQSVDVRYDIEIQSQPLYCGICLLELGCIWVSGADNDRKRCLTFNKSNNYALQFNQNERRSSDAAAYGLHSRVGNREVRGLRGFLLRSYDSKDL